MASKTQTPFVRNAGNPASYDSPAGGDYYNVTVPDPRSLPSSKNPQSAGFRASAGATPLVSPAGENVPDQVEHRMRITAPANRASMVQIYEPAQSQDQVEVILEEFHIDGGETIFKEKRSATAGFRFLPLTEETRLELEKRRLRLEDPAQLTYGQEGFMTPDTQEEMAAGEARQQELAEAEDAPRESRAKRRVAGGTVSSGSADAEVRRGEEDANTAMPKVRRRRGRNKK
jgi:hypothetical protein